ncbi:beta strand repeat-containing protein [Hafnia alvei]|uniref:beta strand repeat-containing protein n=1 Tax=Hafnia alvei TaxID=569 RepID=UPI001D11F2B5|nr:Ig-like domain-containing protein [Hafnia alvei]
MGTDISKVADGKNTFTYTVMVKDSNGNLVSGVTVAPKADKSGVTVKAAGATDANGQTTITLTSSTTAVADITVSTQVGTTTSVNADKTVSFIADAATAQVDTVTLVGTDVSKVADGKNTFTYTVTVKDSNGNLVSGVTVTPKADKTGATATVNGVTDATGQATITLTSTTLAVADITVSAQVGTTTSVNADKTVSFIADATTAQVDTVTLVGTDVSKVADGKNTFTYTVTVKDSNGNLVSGVTVAPKADKTGATATVNGVTDATGQATITLTSSLTVVSDITVSAQVGTTASKNADKTVSFTYGEVATISVATTDGKTTAVVGTQPALTLTVEDELGRKIPNQTINLAISGGSGGKPSIYPPSVTSDAVSGEIADKPLLADTTAETVTVTASLSGSNVKGTLLINFVPDVISTNTSTITADPARIVADGQTTSTVTYVPKDRYGNVITDIAPSTISSTIIGMSNTEFTLSGWTYANKQYTAVVTAGTTTGGFRVVPVIDGNDGVSRSGGNIVTLVAGDIDITQSSIKAVPATIIADGKSTSTLQFVPKDKFGNIIDSLNASSISQVLTGDATDMKVGAWAYNSNSQWYTAMLTAGTMSGAANIMPTVNGENAAQNGVTNTLTLAYSSSVKDIVTTSVGTAIADGTQTNQVTVTIYGANNQIISGATVNITPSGKELLINGQNAVYTGTTDAKGQITVPMASTFIGENQFTVESDQYSEIGNTSFGIYVSPVLSSVSFDKTDLFNNGTDKMTVTFYPVDAKGRAVEGLDVEFASTDAGATLTDSGYKAVVSSISSPSTYFISITMTNYGLWGPDQQQYNLIPQTGVKLATVLINPVLCGSKTLHADFVCSPTPANDNAYIGSGLGFKVSLIDSNSLWDKQLYLTSSNVTENVYITDASNSQNHQNCSAPVSDNYSWMNDYGTTMNIGGVNVPYTLMFKFTSNGESFNTIDLGFSGRGVGICDFPGAKKVSPTLSGKGSIQFTARTVEPKGEATFNVPIAGNRLDKGTVQGVSVYVYSN